VVPADRHPASRRRIGRRGCHARERHRAQTIREALSQAEAKYRSIVESLPAIVYLAQPVPPYAPIYVSPNIAEFGYSAREWFDQPDLWVRVLHEEDREYVLSATALAMSRNLETELEYRVISRDGEIHWVHDKGRFVVDEDGNKITWQGVMVDITKTKVMEEQLKQSQKLESVGRLAGGIAHDFNNMLTAINGYSDLTLRRLKPDDPLRQNIEEIKRAGERSATLTNQLLAFSRKQMLKPEVLYFDRLIGDTATMLQRLIGENIELVTILNPNAGPVEVDSGQLTQVIVNLGRQCARCDAGGRQAHD
jgi:PAS domain S-box-containing protein